MGEKCNDIRYHNVYFMSSNSIYDNACTLNYAEPDEIN